jgi:uncharacterized protein (TIGR02118 family)
MVGAPARGGREDSDMVTVSVIYPNQPGTRFDERYYLDKHIPLVRERWEPMGLTELRLLRGTNTPDGGAAPFRVMALLTFESAEAFAESLGGARPGTLRRHPELHRRPAGRAGERGPDLGLRASAPRGAALRWPARLGQEMAGHLARNKGMGGVGFRHPFEPARSYSRAGTTGALPTAGLTPSPTGSRPRRAGGRPVRRGW